MAQYDPPVYQLTVGGMELKDDYLRLLTSVSVHQHWDMADKITLRFRAWDERLAEYLIVEDELFNPGNDILLRAGYGVADHVVGRYTIMPHRVNLAAGAGPEIEIVGFDGLARLVEGQDAANYRSETTFTDVAVALAEAYDMGYAVDESGDIPKRLRKRRIRSRDVMENDPQLVKPAGDTDVKLVKLLAKYVHFEGPKVRFVESGSSRADAISRSHDRANVKPDDREVGASGGDVLFFRDGYVDRQAEMGDGPFIFRYQPGEGDAGYPASVLSFTGSWMEHPAVTSVRMTGLSEDRKKLVTVEASIVDKKGLLSGQSAGVQVTKTSERKSRRRDRDALKDLGQVNIEILSARRPVKQKNPDTGRREMVFGREVVRTETVMNIVDIEEYARNYLRERLVTTLSGNATLAMTPGIERLYPNQRHQFIGLPFGYNGQYRLSSVTQQWKAGQHTTSVAMEKESDVGFDFEHKRVEPVKHRPKKKKNQ